MHIIYLTANFTADRTGFMVLFSGVAVSDSGGCFLHRDPLPNAPRSNVLCRTRPKKGLPDQDFFFLTQFPA